MGKQIFWKVLSYLLSVFWLMVTLLHFDNGKFFLAAVGGWVFVASVRSNMGDLSD